MSEGDKEGRASPREAALAEVIEAVAEAIFLKEGRAKDVAWKDADKVLALMQWGQSKQQCVTDYYRDIASNAITVFQKATGGAPTAEWQDARDAANVADEIARVTEDACKHLDAFLNLPPEVLTMLATAHLLKERIDYRLNDYLCEMKEGYDDSITGFNEAWDVVRDIFKETFANATTNTREPASRGEANSKSSATQAPEEGE